MKTEQANPCEKYELAITNYVLGEAIPIPKEELFNHLRKCPNCREDLKDWQATYSVMRAEAYDARPEVKARSKAFIKKLASQPLPAQTQQSTGFPTGKVAAWQVPRTRPNDRPVGQVKLIPGEKVLDNEAEIGSVAGKLWHYLAQNGKVKMNEIRHKVKLPNTKVALALGWLAKENKVCLTKKRKTTFVYLAPEEIQKHQAQAQV